MPHVATEQLRLLAARALRTSGASAVAASAAAKYLVAADAEGLTTHGVARVPTYCAHLKSGRAKGAAVPRLICDAGAACLIDAGTGLGFEPCELALTYAVKRAQS